MKVYLGGPINGCTDEEASGWRNNLKPLLEARGYEAVDPMRRDYRGRELEPGVAEEIVKGDIEDIDSCDVLIMNAPKPSVGTSMEIFYGATKNKKIITIIPDDGNEPSPWLIVHSNVIVRGPSESAIAYL